jgi:tetratricopeptide (TPR) repeat protein
MGNSVHTKDAADLNQRGIRLVQDSEILGALDDFRSAARRKPDYPEPWNNAGMVQHMLGRFAEAIADFDQALALRPDYPEALSNRGRARQALGDFAGALADYDRALGLGSTGDFAAWVLHNRGMLRQQCDDRAGALADFDRALATDSSHTATYIARATARKENGDLEGALADFNKALGQRPSRSLAAIYHGRGGVYVLQNDFAGALADYNRALSLEPTNYLFHISRGNARYHLRDPRGTLDYLAAFRIDLDGACREFVRLIGSDAGRDADGVLDNCARHLRLNPRDVVAYARRGLTLLALGRDAEAAHDLGKCRELAPDMWAYLRGVVDLMFRCRFRDGKASSASHGNALCAERIDGVFRGMDAITTPSA